MSFAESFTYNARSLEVRPAKRLGIGSKTKEEEKELDKEQGGAPGRTSDTKRSGSVKPTGATRRPGRTSDVKGFGNSLKPVENPVLSGGQDSSFLFLPGATSLFSAKGGKLAGLSVLAGDIDGGCSTLGGRAPGSSRAEESKSGRFKRVGIAARAAPPPKSAQGREERSSIRSAVCGTNTADIRPPLAGSPSNWPATFMSSPRLQRKFNLRLAA